MAGQMRVVGARVREGESFAGALGPGRVSRRRDQDGGVGESTGALQDMLTSLADFYDEEIGTDLGRFVAAIEPALLIIMGLVITSLLLARTCRCSSSRRWSGPILTVTGGERLGCTSDNRTRGDTGGPVLQIEMGNRPPTRRSSARRPSNWPRVTGSNSSTCTGSGSTTTCFDPSPPT